MIAQGSTEIIRDNLPLQEPNSITTAKTAFSLGGSDDSFLEFGFDCFFFCYIFNALFWLLQKMCFYLCGNILPPPHKKFTMEREALCGKSLIWIAKSNMFFL